jgi:hypothetical protein
MISIYHGKFQALLRYGIIFWGADNESIPIFKLQKRVIWKMCGVGTDTYCRWLLKHFKILTVTSLYVLEVVFYKEDVHPQNSRMYICMIIIQGKNGIYMFCCVIRIS